MIQAQSVSAQLVKLGDLPQGTQQARSLAAWEWLQQEVQALALQHRQDAEGNLWVTLPGKVERTVVLGSRLQAPDSHSVESHIGVVASLETLKAMALRDGGQPPCTLQMVVWRDADTTEAGHDNSASALRAADVAAYLELHAGLAAEGENNGTALGAVGLAAEDGPGDFNPRLVTLCDEAIRELTGVSASLPLATAPGAAAIARAGVPTAAMSVQTAVPASGGAAPRLHLLQAAEAFGRWAEATVHLVAGDEVDLWAREHRVPRSQGPEGD